MIILRPIQQAAQPILKWLFDNDYSSGNRGSGRTTAIAFYLIMRAIETDTWIEPFEHGEMTFRHIKTSIVPRINEMMRDHFPNFEIVWRCSDLTFRVKAKNG